MGRVEVGAQQAVAGHRRQRVDERVRNEEDHVEEVRGEERYLQTLAAIGRNGFKK